MKKLMYLVFVYVVFAAILSAQEIKVHNYIGKSINEVITGYGKPIHQDKSNPAMICTFFRLPNRDYTFVSDSTGVYQADAAINYENEAEAKNALDVFIKDCIQQGYIPDTLSSSEYKLDRKGNKISVGFNKLTNSEKCQIKIDAKKTIE